MALKEFNPMLNQQPQFLCFFRDLFLLGRLGFDSHARLVAIGCGQLCLKDNVLDLEKG